MNTLELFYNETELKSMDEVPILWVITASQMNHKAAECAPSPDGQQGD